MGQKDVKGTQGYRGPTGYESVRLTANGVLSQPAGGEQFTK